MVPTENDVMAKIAAESQAEGKVQFLSIALNL
jgi:hypothetical protein